RGMALGLGPRRRGQSVAAFSAHGAPADARRGLGRVGRRKGDRGGDAANPIDRCRSARGPDQERYRSRRWIQGPGAELPLLGSSAAPADPARHPGCGHRAGPLSPVPAPERESRHARRRPAGECLQVAREFAMTMDALHAARALRAVATREWVRFFNQTGRLLSAVVRPALWLFVFAAGFQAVLGVSVQPRYDTYIAY